MTAFSLRKTFRYLVMFVGFFGWCNVQAQQTTINELQVFRVYTRVNDDPANDDEFRWKLWLNDLYQGCIEVNGDRGTFDRILNFAINSPRDVRQPLKFTLETWENDHDPSCVYNGDEAHCGPTEFYLNLAEHEPYVLHEDFEMAPCSKYKAWIRFSYSVPKAQKPTVSVNNVVVDPNQPVQPICQSNPAIKLSTDCFYSSSFHSATTLRWQYQIAGETTWRNLNTSNPYQPYNNGQYTFTNIRLLPGLTNITSVVNVSFRVISRYDSHPGEPSDPSAVIQLNPVAPTLSDITTQPTCYGKTTGLIEGIVSGAYGNYKYFLSTPSQPCSPEQLRQCGSGNSGDLITNASDRFRINGVPPGTYTLNIANPGDNAGVCYSAQTVVITERPSLRLTATPASASCQSSADASITLVTTGGLQPMDFTLQKDEYNSTNTTGLFRDLTAGTYQATAVDACQQVVTVPVIAPEPVRVHAQTVVSNATCNAPVNGSIQVNMTSSGSPPYAVTLLRGTEVIQQTNNLLENTWTVPHLPEGAYTIEIRDALRLSCDGFTEEITLQEPEPLGLTASNLSKIDVDCFGRSNGSVALTGVDLGGQFIYTLTSVGTSASQALTTTPLFERLPADAYTLTLQRSMEGCHDQFRYPDELRITEPPQSGIDLYKVDISCYGETDGVITAQITGATVSDQFIWEVLLDGNWSSLNNPTTMLQNLSPGTYRMRLTNDYNCTATSLPQSIIEPDRLTVASVDVSDVSCLGEPGEVTTVLHGGTQPYAYVYASSSQTIPSVSERTLLPGGTYTLLGKDSRGCTTRHVHSVVLTDPDAALSMSVVPSDYNGFNISCTGASNGYAVIQPAGGNGSDFSGYEFAIDDSPFQTDAYLGNIGAGNHTFFVRDGRGCTIRTDLLLTEPASQLQVNVLHKEDIRCAGDTNGVIALEVLGGTAPYTYSLNGALQTDGTFTSLPSGNYAIRITDHNHCISETTASILTQVPPMNMQPLQTDVSCYGGDDGSAQVLVHGGAPPFRYQWSDVPDQTPDRTTLTAGIYNLTIIDQQGCAQRQQFIINQPEVLAGSVVTIPVCVGKTDGQIRLQVQGGTPGYRYSLDGGLHYQVTPQFFVKEGNYTVRIRDEHQCETVLPATVTTRTDVPDPNFIVAMTQQASDTLFVREISLPKPDSVLWTFDPAIKVIDNDATAPVITVPDPGNYDITMTGFFGGCDYARTRTLTIDPFDPQVADKEKIPLKVIKTLRISPNANNGRFEMTVEMNVKQRLTVTVYDILGITHYRQRWDKTLGIATTVDISGSAMPGVYIVQAVTETDAMEVRLVVHK